MAKNAGDVRSHKGDSKAINADTYAGIWKIPASRASIRHDSSESIGAGDVGNFYSSSHDEKVDTNQSSPCPEKP